MHNQKKSSDFQLNRLGAPADDLDGLVFFQAVLPILKSFNDGQFVHREFLAGIFGDPVNACLNRA